MARSTGIKRDLRLDKMETYANYYYLNFRSYVGQHGDSYDRFLIRMNEMTESLNIINQVIGKLTKFKKIGNKKNKSNLNPHSLLKYLYPKS
jgi:NADH:ubiquinone oxidoreductase subunit D